MSGDQSVNTIEGVPDEAPIDRQKLPVLVKLFGILCLLGGIATLPMVALVAFVIVSLFQEGAFNDETMTSTVITFVMVGVLVLLAVLFVVFGVRLLRNKRRHAAQTAEVLIALAVAGIICDMMLFGINTDLIFFAVIMVLLIALSGYIDPSLSEERELQRLLRDMETREQVEEGTLGRDETGEGLHHPELLQHLLDLRRVLRVGTRHRNGVPLRGGGARRVSGPRWHVVRAVLPHLWIRGRAHDHGAQPVP